MYTIHIRVIAGHAGDTYDYRISSGTIRRGAVETETV